MVLKQEDIENHSGFSPNLKGLIHPLRNGFWVELDFFPGGDAPKSFIALYEYERDSKIRKGNLNSWPRYIAKVGHKWYPLESINEYLFNRIGEVLGLKMACSKLIMAGEQLRFLSRYFLAKNESLEHGAQIFAGYLADKEFVESIEQQGLARNFFTFQFAEKAIQSVFPKEANQILEEFVKMLVFDAISGNNDRHFYNWGVITHIEMKKIPTFAPVYDSARGLFWNNSEGDLVEKWGKHPKGLDEKIKKYAEGSRPKTGWEGVDDLNHFDLINKIYSTDSRFRNICSSLINPEQYKSVLCLVDKEFKKFYSPLRLELIKKCLTYRFERLMEIIK